MAKLIAILAFGFFAFSLLSSSFLAADEAEADAVFVKKLDKKKLLGFKKEKLSHFRFYWHDVLSGNNPTAVMVVRPVNGSRTYFGSVNMIDNALTVGPRLTSKLIGRAQGFYASTGQHQLGLLMAMNLVFVEGKYNGSTMTLLGHNPALATVREVPVVGGSGLFRFARGYAKLRTHVLDFNTGDATVEYNVYVFHY